MSYKLEDLHVEPIWNAVEPPLIGYRFSILRNGGFTYVFSKRNGSPDLYNMERPSSERH